MGTLLNQEPRNHARMDTSDLLIAEIKFYQGLAKKTGQTYSEIIETVKVTELKRKNNLYVMNGDIFDEQMAGFGELLKEFICYFEEAFGITQSNDAPRFLEAISMALNKHDLTEISVAIDKFSEVIEKGIKKMT